MLNQMEFLCRYNKNTLTERLKGKGCISTHNSRVKSIMARKSRQHRFKTMGHITTTGKADMAAYTINSSTPERQGNLSEFKVSPLYL